MKTSTYWRALAVGALAVIGGAVYPSAQASATTVSTTIEEPSHIDVGEVSVPLDCGGTMDLVHTGGTSPTLEISTLSASGTLIYAGIEFVMEVTRTSSAPGQIASTGTGGSDPDLIGEPVGTGLEVTMDLTFSLATTTACTAGTEMCATAATVSTLSGASSSGLATLATGVLVTIGTTDEGVLGQTGTCNCALNTLIGEGVYAAFELVKT